MVFLFGLVISAAGFFCLFVDNTRASLAAFFLLLCGLIIISIDLSADRIIKEIRAANTPARQTEQNKTTSVS